MFTYLEKTMSWKKLKISFYFIDFSVSKKKFA